MQDDMAILSDAVQAIEVDFWPQAADSATRAGLTARSYGDGGTWWWKFAVASSDESRSTYIFVKDGRLGGAGYGDVPFPLSVLVLTVRSRIQEVLDEAIEFSAARP
jgi:hypothetical protein